MTRVWQEIIPENQEVTIEFIQSLKLSDLKIVASQFFQLKGISRFSKQQLIDTLSEELIKLQPQNIDEQNRQTLKSFVSNEQNQLKAIELGLQLRQLFGRELFTAHQLRNKITVEKSRRILRYNKMLGGNISTEDRIEINRAITEENSTPIESLNELSKKLTTLSLFKIIKPKGSAKGNVVRYRVDGAILKRTLDKIKSKSENKAD